MKALKFNLFIIALLATIVSCDKSEDPVTGDANQGGLMEVQTGTVVYFLNTMETEYEVSLKYYQGYGNNIEKIDVYKQFFTQNDAGERVSSNKSLLTSINLSDKTKPGIVSYPVKFTELVKNLSIDSLPIETVDTLMKPGFYWNLTYDVILKDGRHVQVSKNTVFLNSRFAGTYKVVAAEYYRIGVLTYGLADWPSTVNVTALNGNTYRLEAPCEPFTSNSVYFTIDDASGAIDVLKSYGGEALTINNIAVATCASDPGAYNSVPCDGSNIAIKVASTKDTLKITYGYVTTTGAVGPREFYQVMVKQ